MVTYGGRDGKGHIIWPMVFTGTGSVIAIYLVFGEPRMSFSIAQNDML